MLDLASVDSSSPGKQEAIGRIIEKIITLHEPRLRNVRATMVPPRGLDLNATFQITADLRVDPAPPVAFQTVVQLSTGHVVVSESAS